MRDSYRNPFSGTNAVTLDDQAILVYWCSPFAYRLFSEIKENDIFEDPNNIVFMGGRSTGKTMFLRYWSFPVQMKLAQNFKQSHGKKVFEYFKMMGGIGYYIRVDGLVLRSFSGFGIDIEKWNSIFVHYLELIIGRAYVESIKAINDEGEIDQVELQSQFIPQVASLVGNTSVKNLEGLLNELDARIREVDVYRGNIPFYNEEFRPKIGFASQSLSFGIPRIAKRTLKVFKDDTKFVLLIDEYENFLEHQQRVVNTMLRFTTSDIKLRIGMRLEGFRTTSMISSDDFIKEGREYRKVVFEEVLIKDQGYQDFLREVSRKRLEGVRIFKEKGKTNIVEFLSNSEDLEQEAVEIVSKNPNKILDFFNKHIPSDSMVMVQHKANPLLGLLNILWLLRGVSPEETRHAMEKYLKGDWQDEKAKKYRMDYIDKYKLSLMFVLCSIYRRNKKYYSFNTFSFLSSGIIGNFIELCRRAFQYAEFEDKEGLVVHARISKEQQNKAAMDVSESELQQLIRIEEHGSRIYKFICNLGNVFRDFHKDERIRYPETNQFTVDSNTIAPEDCRRAFSAAIKWSAIQRKSRLQQPAPGKHLRDIFTINRIYCPSFQISYRTRGGYSVPLLPKDIELFMSNENVDSKPFVPKKKDDQDDDQFTMDLFGKE